MELINRGVKTSEVGQGGRGMTDFYGNERGEGYLVSERTEYYVNVSARNTKKGERFQPRNTIIQIYDC